MPIKKRIVYPKHRVLIRDYKDGIKKPPHQKIVSLPIREDGDLIECLVANISTNTKTVGGVWFPVEEIDPGFADGRLFRLIIKPK